MFGLRERSRMEGRAVGVSRVVVPLEVPASSDMSDANFCRHMNLRHSTDLGGAMLEWERSGPTFSGTLAALPAYRAFHDRCHALARPGQYDHQHCEPE